MTAQRARLLLWLGTIGALGVVGYLSFTALIPFLVGAVIAYAIAPLVDRLLVLVPITSPNHATTRRGVAVFVIYMAFFGLVTAVLLWLIPAAAEQVANFIEEVPDLVTAARGQTDGLLQNYRERVPRELQVRVEAMAEQTASTATSLIMSGVQATILTLTSTLSFLLGLAVVPFWMFYVMRDRHIAGRNLVQAAPAEVREDVRLMLALADTLLGRYIRAQLFLGLVVGSAVGGLLALLGVDLSLGLGVWAGVTELVPIIGPWLGAIPGLVLILATDIDMLPWVALVYLAVQQVENNFLVPRIQGQALDLHPGVVILLLVVGGAVFGFLGLVIVVPAAAILRELFWYLDRRLQGQTPEQAFAASHLNRGQHAKPAEPAQPIEAAR